MRKKLIAGNWKMNADKARCEALVKAIASASSGLAADIAVCVPFPYLAQVQSLLTGSTIAWGAQDISTHSEGAFTGEVSGGMLADFGCRYVLVGHSERRAYWQERDDLIARKFAAAQAVGLWPILCVGETLTEREAGDTVAVVGRQLDAVLSQVSVQAFASAVVAYEPVWAIGTGKTASPEQAQEVHEVIRAQVAQQDQGVAANLRILYGGSMKPANAAELLRQPDIDGGLIGGASLVAEEFLAIAAAV